MAAAVVVPEALVGVYISNLVVVMVLVPAAPPAEDILGGESVSV